MRTKLILERFDKEHQLLERREEWSKSWVKHLFDLEYQPLGYAVNTLPTVADIGGVNRVLRVTGGGRAQAANMFIAAPPGNMGSYPLAETFPGGGALVSGMWYITTGVGLKGDDFGIVVGTGGGGPAPADNALTTKIAHGETAGTMLYAGVELYGLTFANPNGQFTIRRYFTNVLGGAIAVTEAGIYAVGWVSAAPDIGSVFCIARDVFGAVNVNNGEILAVTYVPQITV